MLALMSMFGDTIIPKILTWVGSLQWKELYGALQTLFKRQWLILSCVMLLLGIGVYCICFQYIRRTSLYEQTAEETLQRELEETPQRYKGLEALILSGLRRDIGEVLAHAPVDTHFLAMFEEVSSQIEAFATAHDSASPTDNLSADLIFEKNGKEQVYLTDEETKAEKAYLFLPLDLLRGPINSEARKILDGQDANQRQALLKRLIEQDPSLLLDIGLSKVVAASLKYFVGKRVVSEDADAEITHYVDPKAAQVYLITKNGLNRITKRTANLEGYYRNQFSPTLFFPSRPYFRKAFDHLQAHPALPKSTSPAALGDLFFISKPYMDLGGNGVVVTLARAFRRPPLSDAVLCFDLPVVRSADLEKFLADRLTDLDAQMTKISCEIQTSEHKFVTCQSQERLQTDDDRSLVKRIENFINDQNNKGVLSQVTGNIQVIDPAHTKQSPGGLLHILVPTNLAIHADGSDGNASVTTAAFTLVQLDIPKFVRSTTFYGFAGLSCVAVAILLLLHSLGSTVARNHELQKVFGGVAEVMQYAPIPYARLLADDTIADANFAFCRLLGYPSTEESKAMLKQKKFRSFCADGESEYRYHQIEDQRRRGNKVDPYSLRLQPVMGHQKTVKVFSAAIPSDKVAVNALPETFGVLIEADQEIAVNAKRRIRKVLTYLNIL